MHVPDFPGFLPLVLSGQQSDFPPPPTYVCSELNGEWRSVNKTPKFLPPPLSGFPAGLPFLGKKSNCCQLCARQLVP